MKKLLISLLAVLPLLLLPLDSYADKRINIKKAIDKLIETTDSLILNLSIDMEV